MRINLFVISFQLINAAKSTVAEATERNAKWSMLEIGVAQTLRADVFGPVVNVYPKRRKHPLTQSQAEVVLYYLEHNSFMWSPDIFPDREAHLWTELNDLLNVLGPTQTMDQFKEVCSRLYYGKWEDPCSIVVVDDIG